MDTVWRRRDRSGAEGSALAEGVGQQTLGTREEVDAAAGPGGVVAASIGTGAAKPPGRQASIRMCIGAPDRPATILGLIPRTAIRISPQHCRWEWGSIRRRRLCAGPRGRASGSPIADEPAMALSSPRRHDPRDAPIHATAVPGIRRADPVPPKASSTWPQEWHCRPTIPIPIPGVTQASTVTLSTTRARP